MSNGYKLGQVRLILWVCVLAGVLSLGAYFLRPVWLPIEANRQGQALIQARFELTDHTGKAVSEKTYSDRWLLVFFGFTYCPDICPTTLNTVAGVLDALGEQSNQIAPIFISVDPARDNLTTMAEYVAAFHPGLIGLTGTPEQVAAAAKAFRVYYSVDGDKSGDDYQVNHSGILYLMNPNGDYVAHFSHRDNAEKISTAIRNKLRG